jgi:tetratricopeptide (TPR) repeat protein
MADFVWYVPGCMVVVVILGACACRLWQFAGGPAEEDRRARRVSRSAWLAAAGGLAAVGGLMLQDRLAVVRAEPAWHRYVLTERAAPRGSFTRLPPETLEAMADDLTETLRWLPDRGRAHAHLAEVHLAMAEQDDSVVRQGGVKGVRDAALASNFTSPAALRQWLERAFPTSWRHLETAWQHARLAARYAPLEGEAYLFLADVPFFDGPRSPGKEGYVGQALRVRPYDGYVLFEAGREALLAGEPAKAFEWWQESYRTGPTAQRRLEEFLAGVAPAATFIEIFQPDLTALTRMSRLYTERQLPPEELRVVLEHYAAALEGDARALEGTRAADAWHQAAAVFRRLDNPAERIRCLRTAVAADPGHFKARRMLGERLFEMGEYPEAEENLRWCVQWNPRDPKLREELEAAVDGRLRMGSRPEEAPRR